MNVIPEAARKLLRDYLTPAIANDCASVPMGYPFGQEPLPQVAPPTARADRDPLDEALANLKETKAQLEASRQRNRGLVALVESLQQALGGAQTLIAGALRVDPGSVNPGRRPEAQG